MNALHFAVSMGMDESLEDVAVRIRRADRPRPARQPAQHDAHVSAWLSDGIERWSEAAFIQRRNEHEAKTR